MPLHHCALKVARLTSVSYAFAVSLLLGCADDPSDDATLLPTPKERTFLALRWDTLVSHAIERDPRNVFDASAVFLRGDSVDVADATSAG